MKKMLAVTLAAVMMVSMSITAFAADPVPSKIGPDLTKYLKEQNEAIADQKAENERLKQQIDELSKKLDAAVKINEARERKDREGHGSRTDPKPQRQDAREVALKRNNAVSYGGTTVAQGGHVEINNGKSNVTFVVDPVDGGTNSSANSLAASVRGTLLCCIKTSSPGASFKTARANFFVSGVVDNDTIAAYQLQANKWVQVPAEARKDHVIVTVTQHGPLAIVRVPAVAAATN